MPQGAFQATEHQFRSLLHAASIDVPIQLSLLVLEGTPMATHRQDYAAGQYKCVHELWNQTLDGLIVSGAEPTTACLPDEPYWQSLGEVIDWARTNTRSTIWSCLAAHAAALHMDGIERRRSHTKHFGIFSCDTVVEHPLLSGIGTFVCNPHSRWNSLSEQDLAAHDYRVLTRTREAEVDTFIKQESSLFVFFQGHPEYATDTLLREYRRDIGRFLRQETEIYPRMPYGYFDGATEAAFASLGRNVRTLHRDQVLKEVAALMPTVQVENKWQSSAVRIYRNWLEYLSVSKEISLSAATLDVGHSAC